MGPEMGGGEVSGRDRQGLAARSVTTAGGAVADRAVLGKDRAAFDDAGCGKAGGGVVEAGGIGTGEQQVEMRHREPGDPRDNSGGGQAETAQEAGGGEQDGGTRKRE